MKWAGIIIFLVMVLNDAAAQRVGSFFSRTFITRGPYLQMVGKHSAIIRWRTNKPTDSRVAVGTTVGNYPSLTTDTALTTEHEVAISGLQPDTKYYYQVGTTKKRQGNKTNYFTSAPDTGHKEKIRIAAFGDCGRNWFGYQTWVLNAYRNYTKKNRADVMLLLGDNAYNHGTDREYQYKFFSRYGSSILKNHALFPTPGNHDYGRESRASRSIPYYQNFTMPTNGELGGVPSGTEAYYSYNWGNIHFISMDSHGMEDGNTTRLYDTLGAQVTWLKKDLAANKQKWTIMYWHHPPYTKGSHNSDAEEELVKIRTNFIPILERHGVDLVLTGHSHTYERSYLLKDYVEMEAAFNPSRHTADSSSATYKKGTNTCPYLTAAGQVNHGTVYVVAGSSAAWGRKQEGFPHNALPFAHNDGGMLYLEVEDNRLDAKFIKWNRKVADQFTIMKGVGTTTNLHIQSGTGATLTASWIGNYLWSTGETTRSITIKPTTTATYTVNDTNRCVKDSFEVVVRQ
jgi:hypothetical protein